jgi:hypothetical protein
VFLINSRSHLVSATFKRSSRKGFHLQRRTFSRSYGAILPSSFTQVISHALVFSTCLPVSVCSTVNVHLMLRDFSWKPGITFFSPYGPPHHASVYNANPDLPKFATYTLGQVLPITCSASLLRHPFAVNTRTGILTCCPSITLFSLTLGTDSPYADERCVGNLRLPASGNLTRFIVTHVSIRTSDTSSNLLKSPSSAYRTLSYHANFRSHPQLRWMVLAPVHLPRRPTRPVSYYAFFKGWLLLSQPPGCLCLPTTFST